MNIFFDLIILIGIVATLLPGMIILYHRKKSKKSIEYRYASVSLCVGTFLLACTGVLVYGSLIEPNLIITNEVDVDIDGINTPVRAVFLSDIQVGLYKHEAWVERLVQRIIYLDPDIIFLSGDYVENDGTKQEEWEELAPLKQLAERYPVYAVPGNHEYGATDDPRSAPYVNPNVSQEVQHFFESIGVRYLVNQTESITIQHNAIRVFGGDWAERLSFSSLKESQTTMASTTPTIMLVHSPSAIWQAANYSIDLLLAGHTHGGQIRIPFLGPLGRVEPTIPTSWYQGLHEYQGLQFFVTSGAGASLVRSRLFNPPEIVLLTLY